MGTWEPQEDTQNRTGNIPATPGETTYNSELYYIGLKKNGEPTTITISDFTITKPDWVKDVSFNKSQNDNYYQLTYKVDENSDTSEREGIISIMHKDANKSIEYQITQAANTTGSTEPTPNEYVFQITEYHSNNNQSVQVNDYSADPDNNVSFAWINTGDINDSTSLNIDIKIALAATNDTTGKNPTFNFIIRCVKFKIYSSIDNAGITGYKSVDIMLGGERKGNLIISRNNTTVSGGLNVHITIFSNNQDPKALTLLSEDTISKGVLSDGIEGKITINSHDIRFKVTLGFGALQQ